VHSWRWLVLLGPWSVDQLQGLLCLIAKVEPYDLGTGTPNFRAPRLGPRAFSVGAVNLLDSNFVW
jgi:hypothetical protein